MPICQSIRVTCPSVAYNNSGQIFYYVRRQHWFHAVFWGKTYYFLLISDNLVRSTSRSLQVQFRNLATFNTGTQNNFIAVISISL